MYYTLSDACLLNQGASTQFHEQLQIRSQPIYVFLNIRYIIIIRVVSTVEGLISYFQNYQFCSGFSYPFSFINRIFPSILVPHWLCASQCWINRPHYIDHAPHWKIYLTILFLQFAFDRTCAVYILGFRYQLQLSLEFIQGVLGQFPNGHFPRRAVPQRSFHQTDNSQMDISPNRHYPERTFPRTDISLDLFFFNLFKSLFTIGIQN